MSHKLQSLKLDLLLKELKLLDLEKEYVDEFTNHYRPIFMDELAKNGYKVDTKTGETISNTTSQKTQIDVDENELKIIKNVFRSIAKICHPDKTKNIYRNKLYEEAQFAYEMNDLLTLYKITKKLKIEIKLNLKTIVLLDKIVEDKKKELKSVETSYLWLWVNENDEEKKLAIIKQFIDKYGI